MAGARQEDPEADQRAAEGHRPQRAVLGHREAGAPQGKPFGVVEPQDRRCEQDRLQSPRRQNRDHPVRVALQGQVDTRQARPFPSNKQCPRRVGALPCPPSSGRTPPCPSRPRSDLLRALGRPRVPLPRQAPGRGHPLELLPGRGARVRRRQQGPDGEHVAAGYVLGELHAYRAKHKW